jgi:hypothetical protein
VAVEVEVVGTIVPTAAVPPTALAHPARQSTANSAIARLTGIRMANLPGLDQLSVTEELVVKIVRARATPASVTSLVRVAPPHGGERLTVSTTNP